MATKYWLGTTSTSFNTAANWSDAAAPANSDTLIFNYRGNAGNSCTTNLSTILTGITLIVDKSYTNDIGVLSDTVATYLVLDGGTVHIGQQTGQGSASGSTLLMIDTGSTAATFNIYDSSSSSASIYYPPILLKCASTSIVNMFGGSAGVAALTGETATATFKVAKGAGSIDPTLYLGEGVTVTAIYQKNGTVYSRSNQTATLVEKSDGTYRYAGSGATTTLNNYGGTVYSEGTGTITNLKNGGTVDFSRDSRAKTVTNCEVYDGSTLDLRTGVGLSVTFTNGIDFYRCGPQDTTLRMEPHVTLTPSAV
jgi:hypothetical protein